MFAVLQTWTNAAALSCIAQWLMAYASTRMAATIVIVQLATNTIPPMIPVPVKSLNCFPSEIAFQKFHTVFLIRSLDTEDYGTPIRRY